MDTIIKNAVLLQEPCLCYTFTSFFLCTKAKEKSLREFVLFYKKKLTRVIWETPREEVKVFV